MRGKDGSENERRTHHPKGRGEDGLASAESADAHKQEQASCDNLDSTVDASSKQGPISLRNVNGLGDLRCAGVNAVDVTEVRTEHHHEASSESIAYLGAASIPPK
jgi:hypothetical protein